MAEKPPERLTIQGGWEYVRADVHQRYYNEDQDRFVKLRKQDAEKIAALEARWEKLKKELGEWADTDEPNAESQEAVLFVLHMIDGLEQEDK